MPTIGLYSTRRPGPQSKSAIVGQVAMALQPAATKGRGGMVTAPSLHPCKRLVAGTPASKNVI